MYDIIIFGGGLSGLTIAHELIKKGFKILIVEKDNELGGMARSDTKKNKFPSENSWRGYAPFYKNASQLMKEIPYNNTNVFNNLSIPVDFYLLYDKEYRYKSSLTIKDKIILYYLGINYLLSDKRREYYYSYYIEPFLKKYLSTEGYNHIINFVTGPGYGMNKNEISMGHLFHFPILSYIQKEKYTHSHSSNGNEYEHNSTDNWHVMNGPTNDVWINPWIKYLKAKGVDILTNTELVKINYNKNNITSVEIKRKGLVNQLKAKEYILSTNPFNTVDILKNSKMKGLYNNFKSLTDNTKSKQISFRIGINKKIKYPIDNIAFVMNDSEFNITWYPQEKHWKQKPKIKSLWSGTIIDFEKKGKLFGKNAENLDNKKLKKEIIYQILRSKSFRKLIYDNNRFYINKEDIEYIEIWYEWSFNNGNQEQLNKKWVNNIYNEKFRPLQKTEYDNLFLSGAHTKTTINIWSMEGAIESGKITANYILDKYNKPNIKHYKHHDPSYIKQIQCIDNVLYKLYLPNIMTLLITVILIFILYIYYKSF
jgi:uncharacterized protein with NAD-binding domain and iron-sulfur cluster